MRRTLAIPAALGALASCQTTEPPVREPVLDTRVAMVAGVNPAAVAIWDITNEAMDDAGELDPVRMDDEAWARLREAAQMLEAYSLAMAEAEVIRAGGPDLVGREVPEGVATRAEIQAMIDADPAGFRAEARDLAERARLLVEAARVRDVAAAGHRAAEIDVPCQGCHSRYWYKQETQEIEEGRPRA
jgi:cytochrome c556